MVAAPGLHATVVCAHVTAQKAAAWSPCALSFFTGDHARVIRTSNLSREPRQRAAALVGQPLACHMLGSLFRERLREHGVHYSLKPTGYTRMYEPA